ncbi:peptidase U32-like protein [Prauserella shujinwangii]|uniref:Peptidase U32-like protein n=1 Tax=Prauserella shujinwangii TaxID=1453103 RepID=A0A2T0LZ57_9PSEU|nr:U32 family peptidase [Prauserella shujinwangii]PRX49401.1 peptidase U32-like protein [Prauserella shujinwangii]
MTDQLLPGEAQLRTLGLDVTQPRPPASQVTFPDGGAWRVEIPSVEGPEALTAVLEESAERDVPVHRVSQGSGVMMLDDAEITDMLALGADRGVEVCLFLGPRGTWDVGAATRTPTGGAGPRARGRDQLGQCLQDCVRAAELGVRNLLVADEGVLWAAHRLRSRGDLPADLRFKLSVLTGPVNPAAFAVWAALGADSVNVPSDLTTTQVAELRAASPAAIDMYLEAPDDVGGFVRLYDAAELIRVGAPLYLKFGLRNAPGIYPVGRHLRDVAISSARERVRRARLALDILERGGGAPLPMSKIGDPALPVPDRFGEPVAAGGA